MQVDTASSVRNDVAAIRAALDAAGHPALLAVDSIACLACDRFEMDAWGVDVMVAACQKGLMTPPGLAFTFQGARAMAERVRCPSPYWDWGPRTAPEAYYQLFCGTAPTHHLYGLRAALDMILDEEGLEAVWRRHAVFARAVWAAVDAWGAEGALELNIADPGLRSHAVTTIRTAPGRRHAAPALVRRDRRADARHRARASRGSIRTASSASATWGTSTRRCCSARWRRSRPGSSRSASAHGPGGVAAAAAVIAEREAPAAASEWPSASRSV